MFRRDLTPRKWVASAAAAISTFAALYAGRADADSLKSYVFKIETKYAPEVNDALEQWATALEKAGARENAEHFRGLREGSGGTGWLFTYRGKSYIVTNAHVVEGASSCEISQDSRSSPGTFHSLGGCDILLVDSSHDLAVLVPPPGIRLNAGLDLGDDEVLRNNRAIFAAGFPGSIGMQYWSNTPGAISNPRVQGSAPIFKQLNVQLDHVISHTAIINHGNSGGPLLADRGDIKGACSEATPRGCVVVGVNTYLVAGNQYFAIPAKHVAVVLGSAVEKHALMRVRASRLDRLNTQVKIFVSELKKAKTDIADQVKMAGRLGPMISNGYAGLHGSKRYLELIAEMKGEEGNNWLLKAVQDPISAWQLGGALDMMLLMAEFGDLSGLRFDPENDLAASDLVGIMGNEPHIQCTLQTKNGPIDIVWGIEYGDWKIVDHKIQRSEDTSTTTTTTTTSTPTSPYGEVYHALMRKVRGSR